MKRTPASCPVCDGKLTTTRLSCQDCGTELVGDFGACSFCALDPAEMDIVKVFLSSRGNMRDLERHLGVSYPTARARFAAVLNKLGLSDNSAKDRDEILRQVAAGELSAEDAAKLLG
ncbi:MAG: DUF2089 domain-containing protein [Propionibacteriaceae bacterium]|jgi:hypothetical protein|nr:DUF2089 domain-containing protein [Propionibacteriaceae bacterium]